MYLCLGYLFIYFIPFPSLPKARHIPTNFPEYSDRNHYFISIDPNQTAFIWWWLTLFDNSLLYAQSFHMKLMKRAYGAFHKFQMKWPWVFEDSVCHLTFKMWFFFHLQTVHSFNKKCMADVATFNDIKYMCQNVKLYVIIWFFLQDLIHWKIVTSYDNKQSMIYRTNRHVQLEARTVHY